MDNESNEQDYANQNTMPLPLRAIPPGYEIARHQFNGEIYFAPRYRTHEWVLNVNNECLWDTDPMMAVFRCYLDQWMIRHFGRQWRETISLRERTEHTW